MARKVLAVSLKPSEQKALVADIAALIEAGRRASARSVNSAMTTTYWHIGRIIVEREPRGARRAEYGAPLLEGLAEDLSKRFGRGFSRRNIEQMRAFYLAWPGAPRLPSKKAQTASALSRSFALPWSHYVRLLAVSNDEARAFYEEEALRGGWTIRQLARQVETQFYERTALSKNKASMLAKAESAKRPMRSSPKRN